ncbi:MAG: flagellar hook-basal body complex protein [Archangium sp.]|nr:flagellar hook-basal body complex protein [Archangium sp.]
MRTLIISCVVLTACGSADNAYSEQACASLGAQAFVQGTINRTDIPSDLALDGPGFFAVADDQGTWFSRNGSFTIDATGTFRQVPTGARLQKSGGGDLTLGNALMPAGATANITLKGNLDAAAPIQVFDPLDPANSSSAQSTTTVYDSLGTAYSVDVYWTKTSHGTWEFHAMADGGRIQGSGPGFPVEIAGGTVDFDGNGRLINVTQTSHFLPLEAVAPQELSFNIGDPLGIGTGTGLAGVTQFRAPSATSFAGGDGYPSGALVTFQVSATGELLGEYTNGVTSLLGVISTAVFTAPQALAHRGDGLFRPTLGSGQPVLGLPGDAIHPAIVSGALEQLPRFTCAGN